MTSPLLDRLARPCGPIRFRIESNRIESISNRFFIKNRTRSNRIDRTPWLLETDNYSGKEDLLAK